MNLTGIDISICIIGLVLVLATALAASSKSSTSQDFFLASRAIPFWAVGPSLLAANIGNEHFVGQAGTAARTGLAVALYEWTASFLLFLLGFVFGVEYLNQKISTIPEWFERRFNIESRIFLAVLSLISAVVTKISASLFAGALLCEVVLGINFWLSLPFILMLTGGYSMVGGLKAVVYTDVMQAIIFMIGGTVGSLYAVNAVGGWDAMKGVFDQVGLHEFPHVIRPLNSEFSWLGMFTGQILGSIWYWCIDQEMSQRVLCAKSIRHGKCGVIFAGFLKILPPFIIAFPGMAARVMYERCALTSGLEFPAWCSDSQAPPGDNAYLYLITRTFPPGVAGLILVSMVVSMMSALSAVFNSASAVFTIDIYLRLVNPKASQYQMVMIGRVFTTMMVVASFGWLLAIKSQTGGIYIITQEVQTHVAPPLATVAIMGIFSKKVTGKGALSGIVVGTIVGVTQYIIKISTGCINKWWCLQFNYFAVVLGLVTFLTTAAVSKMWPEIVANEQMMIDTKFEDKGIDSIDETFVDEMTGKSEATKDKLLLLAGIAMLITVVVVIFVFR